MNIEEMLSVMLTHWRVHIETPIEECEWCETIDRLVTDFYDEHLKPMRTSGPLA